jgi:hypothetical protein
MANIFINEVFLFNRFNHPVIIKHNPNLTYTLPRKSIVFAKLSEKIKPSDVLENLLGKKFRGLLVSYDFEFECAIIHNTTNEDLYLEITQEPIYIINNLSDSPTENKDKNVCSEKKQKSKCSDKS